MGVVMGTKGGVTDGITPVDQTLLERRLDRLETGRDGRKGERPVEGAGECVGELVVGDVGANAPVGSLTFLRLVGVDQLPFPQAPYLVVDDVEDPDRVLNPVGFRLPLGLDLGPRVADEDGLEILEDGLQPQVVVDTPVG